MREKIIKRIDSAKLKLKQAIYDIGVEESNKELRKKKLAIAEFDVNFISLVLAIFERHLIFLRTKTAVFMLCMHQFLSRCNKPYAQWT